MEIPGDSRAITIVGGVRNSLRHGPVPISVSNRGFTDRKTPSGHCTPRFSPRETPIVIGADDRRSALISALAALARFSRHPPETNA
jgi:hypothetical protein